MSDPTQGGATSVSFEEIERQQAAGEQKPLDLNTVKLDGDDIPEALRGKSVQELVAKLTGTEQALRLSEDARLHAERQPPAAAPVAAAPAPEPPKEVSDDEIRQLYEEDPIKGIEAMSARAVARAERNLESRLGPLVAGSSASAEAAARAKYPDEFELFGDDIAKVVASVPNAKVMMANPGAWSDLIALVRGRDGNFDKLLAHKQSKAADQSRRSAQELQAAQAGFSGTGGSAPSGTRSAVKLDALQQEIARNMNMTDEQYIAWMRVS